MEFGEVDFCPLAGREWEREEGKGGKAPFGLKDKAQHHHQRWF